MSGAGKKHPITHARVCSKVLFVSEGRVVSFALSGPGFLLNLKEREKKSWNRINYVCFYLSPLKTDVF